MNLKPVYQIYTFEPHQLMDAEDDRFLKWDLHSITDHKEKSLLQAKILLLEPQFKKIQVEKVFLCPKTGQKHSKTIKILKKPPENDTKKRVQSVFDGIKTFIL